MTTVLSFPGKVVQAGGDTLRNPQDFRVRRVTDALYVTPLVQQDQQDATQAEEQRIAVAVEQETAGLRDRFEEQQKQKQVAMIREQLFTDGELQPMVRAMHGSSSRVIVRPARPHDRALGQVPVGQRVAGLVRLPGLAEGAEPQEITFTAFAGRRMVVTTAEEPTWVFVPKREEEVRQEQLDEAAKGTIALHLQGIYGAIWLGDGAGLELSDATSFKGLGVRAQYAFNRWLAFEGEVMGGSTGDAQFEDVTYEGEQGDLARSASLGRAQFGGVLRFGQGPVVPLARLGVGLQGASLGGTLTTATGDAPGPESFEFDALWYFGAGLELRLGEHVRAGFTASGAAIGGNLQSIEAGIHIGYAWHP